MNTFLIILLLGISLSMDAFSLSIYLGTILSKKDAILFIVTVGVFHFIMPVIGSLVGFKISNLILVNGDLIFGIILLFLSIQVFINLFKNEEEDKIFTKYQLILLAFGVAIDSFGIGFGLSFSNNFMFYSIIIFSICSMIFSYVGLILGKYTNKILGIYSKLLGGILLFVFAIIHLIKI